MSFVKIRMQQSNLNIPALRQDPQSVGANFEDPWLKFSIKAWLNLALVYQQQNQHRPAIEALERVLQLEPQAAEARTQLEILKKKGSSL